MATNISTVFYFF